jgi:pimeloyl-ACP methyl ester carboxylesterase
MLPWLRAGYRRRRFPGADTKTLAEFAVQLRAFSAADFELMRAVVRRPLPPTVVAYACDDHLIETEVAEELAAALPGARVLAFADGGHNIQKTRAVELGAAIRELIAGVPGADSRPRP